MQRQKEARETDQGTSNYMTVPHVLNVIVFSLPLLFFCSLDHIETPGEEGSLSEDAIFTRRAAQQVEGSYGG